MNLLHTFIVDDIAVEVLVNEKTGGFHVVMRDLDAGMTLPVVNIYRTEAAAVAYAKTCAA